MACWWVTSPDAFHTCTENWPEKMKNQVLAFRMSSSGGWTVRLMTNIFSFSFCLTWFSSERTNKASRETIPREKEGMGGGSSHRVRVYTLCVMELAIQNGCRRRRWRRRRPYSFFLLFFRFFFKFGVLLPRRRRRRRRCVFRVFLERFPSTPPLGRLSSFEESYC